MVAGAGHRRPTGGSNAGLFAGSHEICFGFLLILIGAEVSGAGRAAGGKLRLADTADVSLTNCESENASCKRICRTAFSTLLAIAARIPVGRTVRGSRCYRTIGAKLNPAPLKFKVTLNMRTCNVFQCI